MKLFRVTYNSQRAPLGSITTLTVDIPAATLPDAVDLFREREDPAGNKEMTKVEMISSGWQDYFRQTS
jgi:hypothetical protein